MITYWSKTGTVTMLLTSQDQMVIPTEMLQTGLWPVCNI